MPGHQGSGQGLPLVGTPAASEGEAAQAAGLGSLKLLNAETHTPPTFVPPNHLTIVNLILCMKSLSVYNLYSGWCSLVSLGCCNRMPQAGQLEP